MNLDTIKPALKSWVASLSGLVCVWIDEPRPFTPPGSQAIALLSFVSISSVGSDENNPKQDLAQPLNEELSDEWRGNRKATLTIKVESEIQTDTGSAYWYLETVRDRILFRGSLAALRAVNVAFIRVAETVDLTTILDDRNRSIASLDVFLSVRTSTPDPQRYGYVNTAGITGTLSP